MICPRCNSNTLSIIELEAGLLAKECESCGGHWISSESYQKWRQSSGEILPKKEAADITLDAEDSMRAKLCLDCGRILIRYKVGHGTNFHLDHCSACKGVWFDKNEWSILKARNLHDEVHDIFSTNWQKQIRQEEIKQREEQRYQELFGEENLQKIKEFKQWLLAHEKKEAVLAYLSDFER